MLTDVEELSKQMAALNEAFAAITERGAEAEKLLKETESKLTEGGPNWSRLISPMLPNREKQASSRRSPMRNSKN